MLPCSRRFCRLFVCCLSVVLLGAAAAHATATTYTVNSTADTAGSSTTVTLRYAITQANANPGSTITFSSTLNGSTITLASTLPAITANMTIQGPGANLLTISGAGKYMDFQVTSGTVTISGLTIADGVGTCGGTGFDYGGGVCVLGGTSLTVADSNFSGNSSVFGAGIYFQGTTLTVVGSTFTDNSSTLVNTVGSSPTAGAIAVGGGSATIVNDTFSGNSATSIGGAIVTASATHVAVTNSTFSGNSAGNGGAIYSDGTLNAYNNIFAENSSHSSGGGILNSGGATTNADSNVYWHNLANGSESDCPSCTSNTNAVSASSNPLALPLGYYGGQTETYLPQPGSAAICAADPAEAVDAGNNPLTTDQRGFPLSSANCANSGVDAGAVQTAYQQVTNINDSGAGSLRAAVINANTAGYGDISFASSLNGQAINLTSGTLSLTGTSGINIIGPGANQLTVNGGGSSSNFSVFTVNSGATAFLDGLTIANGNTSIYGGGINNAGTLTVLDSTFSANSAIGGGGINNAGKLAVLDSTFSANSAADGGAIDNVSGGALTVTGSTISGNQAFTGGGIYSYGSFTLTGSTVTGNSTTCSDPLSCFTAGGILLANGTVTLANSIVAGNSVAAPPTFPTTVFADINGSYTPASGGGNLVGTSTTGTSNVDPQLSPLQYNGIGATVKTMIPLPGSPAICAGKAANIPSGVTTDERGYPNTNTSYAGYSATSPCVDAGAVQTNYTGVQFVQQPTDTMVNTAITPSPSVEVLETDPLLSSNNTDSVAGVPITLDYSGGAGELAGGAATLTATTASTTINKQTVNAAAYSLTPNTTGSGFTLAAGSTGAGITVTSGTTLTATSNSFSVYGAAASLVVSATTPITAGETTDVQVTAVDKNGHTVLDDDDTVVLTITGQSAALGDVTLTNGTGSANIVLTAGGAYTITATDTTTPTVAGISNLITVNKLATTTTLSVNNGSITPGQSVTLKATVTSSIGTPTGTVNFYDSGALLGPGTLTNGVAILNTTALSAGVTNSLTATYEGNTTYLASTTTAPVTVVVAPLDFTLSVTGASIATVVPGKPATFTMTVDPLYGSYAGPVGFNVTGLPSGATYTISPSTVAANAGKQTVTLTIVTAPTTASMHKPQPLGRKMAPIGLALLLLPFFGAGSMRRQGRRLSRLLCVLLAVGALGAAIGLSGCSSPSGFFAQQAKGYNMTVTATAGSLQHTTTVTLNIE